jgi:hypothetical protein
VTRRAITLVPERGGEIVAQRRRGGVRLAKAA